jgi:outer membrane protein assembly factor BamB
VIESGGAVRWQRNLNKEFNLEKINMGFDSSPVILGDILVLNVNTSGIALNRDTGELIWTSCPDLLPHMIV